MSKEDDYLQHGEFEITKIFVYCKFNKTDQDSSKIST